MLERVKPSKRFEQDLDELRRHYPRIDEVASAVQRELAVKPLAGSVLPTIPETYIFLSYPIYPMPVFKVLYKFSSSNFRVVLLLRIAPATYQYPNEE